MSEWDRPPAEFVPPPPFTTDDARVKLKRLYPTFDA